jgi:hypothetical protein
LELVIGICVCFFKDVSKVFEEGNESFACEKAAAGNSQNNIGKKDFMAKKEKDCQECLSQKSLYIIRIIKKAELKL